MLNIPGGIEITSIADIPARGSGLGSSSSFTVGVTSDGDLSVTPVTASVTEVVCPEAVPSDGRVGLAFEQAVETANSASALQIPNTFSFMCSYHGLEFEKNTRRSQSIRDEGWETCQRE